MSLITNYRLVGSKNKELVKSIKELIGLTSDETSNINFKKYEFDLKEDLPQVCINKLKTLN